MQILEKAIECPITYEKIAEPFIIDCCHDFDKESILAC
jgi:hypothetical protein